MQAHGGKDWSEIAALGSRSNESADEAAHEKRTKTLTTFVTVEE
jgi:hypothetical protein